MSVGQGVGECIFDVVYLSTAFTLGTIMLVRGPSKYFKMYGAMAVLLACGDAFHLVPRFVGLLTQNMQPFWLGLGKLITSITMTAFYILLYFILELRIEYTKRTNIINRSICFLMAALRVILCCFPQNDWFSANTTKTSYAFGIARNAPFAVMGIQVIVMCFTKCNHKDKAFYIQMGVAVILSFAFYLPVVFAGHIVEMLGMLMIPKTCAYVWAVVLGYVEMTQALKKLSNVDKAEGQEKSDKSGVIWQGSYDHTQAGSQRNDISGSSDVAAYGAN